ncbi:MAG: class I SAM-dependent methyltransferase [Pseudoxanthomonas sp.]|nr:class I SAM-dependent methyltransferase [Pseudoxanthomonas sp.]
MLPIHKIIWHEWREKRLPARVPEPEYMVDPAQIQAYVTAYEWNGPASALQLYHLTQLASMIRPGDTVVDLACGPGPLLLELAPLFPDCLFIGADLSQPMLDALSEAAAQRGLRNVHTLCEDIRDLPSLADLTVDMVISTSALHHLPDLECLDQVFARVERLLKPDGGFYSFDFGLVRSAKARALLVADVARRAPALTAQDYRLSLDAAFPMAEVIASARRALSRPLTVRSSWFVDFFYFIRTRDRGPPAPAVLAYVQAMRARCDVSVRAEAAMLQRLQRVR